MYNLIPRAYTHKVTDGLDLSKNSLSDLSNLRYKCLIELDMDGNQISIVQPGAFSDLVHLTYVYLDSNQLKSIQSAKLFARNLESFEGKSSNI
ncbi:uncharacterized protein LOC144872294 [Branchiostoma floridae x Branchiostoma japonicum]